MTIDQLLAALAQNQIVVFLDGDRLRYRAPEGALAAGVRVAVSEHYTAIIERLRGGARPMPPRPTKCMFCDRRHWVDEQPKGDRIRTVCGKCGGFIGYRLVGLRSG